MTYEQEKKARALFTEPNGKYNYYQLNSCNPLIGRLMDAAFTPQYQPCGDGERVQFERVVWELIRKWYRAYNRKIGEKRPLLPPLYEPQFEGLCVQQIPPSEHVANNVIGWQYEYLENFINSPEAIKPDKAVQLFREAWEKCLTTS